MVALPKTEPTSSVSKLFAPTKELHKALAALARVADRKSTLTILANVLITGNRFTTCDLNTWLTFHAPVEWGVGIDSLMVNAKALADIVKQLPGDETSLGRTGHYGLCVASGSTDTTLIGSSVRDYPKIPTSESLTFTACHGAAFKSMIERVLFSVCLDETRFHLNGVYWESRGSQARMVTTDGHRLTLVDERLTIAGDDSVFSGSGRGVIIPAKAAREIAKLLVPGECRIAVRGAQMFVQQGTWELCTRLIEAQFPPYEQVIPADHAKLVTVERKPLIAALKRAKALTSETRGVKLSVAGGKLTLTSDHPDLGTASESLKAESQWIEMGGRLEIGFNSKYLIEVLAEINCKHVTMAFGSELDPVLIRGTEDAVSYAVRDSRYLGVIMPMRI